MSRFGPDPFAFFQSVYRDPAPWDIGGAQPSMVALLEEFPPKARVLDIGCGTGDLAIHVARSGVPTLGIDFVEAAIVEANARKASVGEELGDRLEFRVADALRPTLLQETFGAVVDSGFFHLFEAGTGERLVNELSHVLRPGGRLYLHEFAVTFPVPNVPRAVTEEELRGLFTEEKGWRILAIREGDFRNRIAPVPAILACLERVTDKPA